MIPEARERHNEKRPTAKPTIPIIIPIITTYSSPWQKVKGECYAESTVASCVYALCFNHFKVKIKLSQHSDTPHD